MNRSEHILTQVMEECAEVAQRVSKAMRFGMEQIQEDANDKPEQNPNHLTNRERILEEFIDLQALMDMAGFDPWSFTEEIQRAVNAKQLKVEKYLERARRCGTLI